MNRFPALLPLLPLLGCDTPLFAKPDCPPLHARAGGECAIDERAVSKLMRNFDDGQMVQINQEPFDQVMGERTSRNVFVLPLPAADGLTSVDLYRMVDPFDFDDVLPSAFPVGTAIVHERIDRVEGNTIQVRLADDYANEAGEPWWFGKFYDDGTPDENACSPCSVCHSAANAGTEGLIGVPVDALRPPE